MKKVLLSLIALLSVLNVNAQVTKTDVSGYSYVFYAEDITALPGTTVTLPIYMKNSATVASFQTLLSLPSGVEFVKTAGLDESRYDKGSSSYLGEVFGGNPQDDGSIMLIGTVLEDNGFNVGDSPIGYVSISIADDMANGEYPIVMKSSEFSGIDGVGSSSKSLSDEIVSILTIVDYITLDETSTVAPVAAENVNVLVKRTIKGGEWGTICLPFAMTEDQVKEAFGGDVKLADFDNYDETYDEDEVNVISIVVNFNSVNAIEENHPYLIYTSSDIETFRVDGVTINPSEDDPVVEYDNGLPGKRRVVYGTFTGTYVAQTVVPENALFLGGGNFYYSTGKTKMKAFRGYFDFVDELANKVVANNVKMEIGTTTKVDGVNIANSNGAVYTVDGKFVGRDVDQKKLQKGVYIIDGKKVAIK